MGLSVKAWVSIPPSYDTQLWHPLSYSMNSLKWNLHQSPCGCSTEICWLVASVLKVADTIKMFMTVLLLIWIVLVTPMDILRLPLSFGSCLGCWPPSQKPYVPDDVGVALIIAGSLHLFHCTQTKLPIVFFPTNIDMGLQCRCSLYWDIVEGKSFTSFGICAFLRCYLFSDASADFYNK